MDHLATPSASSASAGGLSKGETTNHPRKTRSACNHCHTQKLRCVRNQGVKSCERCLKLHKSCRYGQRAPRASLKPPISTNRHEMPSMAAASTPMPNADLHIPVMNGNSTEWPFSLDVGANIAEDQDTCYSLEEDNGLDMRNIWPDTFYESEGINQYGFPEMDLLNQLHATFPSADADNSPRIDDYDAHDAHDHLEASPASVIRKLADLNVELYECSLNLPSIPKAGVDVTKFASYGRSTRKDKLFAIDELFRLTSEFIDIVKSLSSTTRDKSSSRDQSSRVLPVAENTQQLSPPNQSITRGVGSSTSFSYIDEGTMLMVMSCHCRITETYQSIFEMIQACIELSAVPQIDKGAGIILPQLQIGSHVAPQLRVDANTVLESGTSEMYMLLITILSGSLCRKLTDVIGVRDEAAVEFESTPQYHVVATIRERTNRLGRSIDTTKHLLQRFPSAPI